jgi:DNA-directed RNA polymerase sigma subunit (sigma70/sigma32)
MSHEEIEAEGQQSNDGEYVLLQEIADEMGVSRSYIKRILASGVAKLRHPSRARFLKPFWEEL